MTKPKGTRIKVRSDTPLTEKGIRVSTSGDIFYHDGVAESQANTVTSTQTFTSDQEDALANANNPSASNPLATLADTTSGGGGGGGGVPPADESTPSAGFTGSTSINNVGTFTGYPTKAAIESAAEGLVAYWDGSMIPIRMDDGTDWGVPSCDGENLLKCRPLIQNSGSSRPVVPFEETAKVSNLFEGYMSPTVGHDNTGYFTISGNSDGSYGQPFWQLNSDNGQVPGGHLMSHYLYMPGMPGATVSNQNGTLPMQAVFPDDVLTSPDNDASYTGRIPTGEYSFSVWLSRRTDFTGLPLGTFVRVMDLLSIPLIQPTFLLGNGHGQKTAFLVGQNNGSGDRNAIRCEPASIFSEAIDGPMGLQSWHNFVVTYNDITATARWYWDGVLKESVDYSSILDLEGNSLQSSDGINKGIVGTAYRQQLFQLQNHTLPALLGQDVMRFTGMGMWFREIQQADVTAIYGNSGESYHLQKSPYYMSAMNNLDNHPDQVT